MSERHTLKLEVGEMHLEYAGCGSHEMAVSIPLSDYEWRSLRRSLLEQIAALDAAFGPDISDLQSYHRALKQADWAPNSYADDLKRQTKVEALAALEARRTESPLHEALWVTFADWAKYGGELPAYPTRENLRVQP